jgi:hypothetical protein
MTLAAIALVQQAELHCQNKHVPFSFFHLITEASSLQLHCMQLRWYNDKNFTARVNTLPAAMTCPGTKAAEMIRCFAGATWNEGACPADISCKSFPASTSCKLFLPAILAAFRTACTTTVHAHLHANKACYMVMLCLPDSSVTHPLGSDAM